jgi:toluene monooxygenase system ferredoxin subunit
MRRVCAVQDLAVGEMREFELEGKEIIITWPTGGEPKAYDAACPHEGISLAFGEFDGEVLICGGHQWSFDARTGCGIFPEDCQLKSYPLVISGDEVLVDI